MPVDGSALGATLGPARAALTARRAMAYAAGIPDRNPRYFDDTAADPVPAPRKMLPWWVVRTGAPAASVVS
jgi:hypothetical protein